MSNFIKKLTIFIFLVLINVLLCASASGNNKSLPLKGLTLSDLNLRDRPSSKSGAIITVIPKNRELTVLQYSASSKWGRVNYNNKSGWVYLKYVKLLQRRDTQQNENTRVGPTDKGKVVLRKEPKVGYKNFLIVNHKRIGFGTGGVELDGTYYPDGTVFAVDRLTDDRVCLEINNDVICYERKHFNGSYGSAGSIHTAKWDFANNRPTGYDMENQVLRRYYHNIILVLNNSFLPIFAVLATLSILLFLLTDKDKKRLCVWVFIVFVLFVLLGWVQGDQYRDYLNEFDKIGPSEASGAMKVRGLGGFAIVTTASLGIKHSGGYIFVNIIYVPIFIAFHVLLFPFLGNFFPNGIAFLHYLFIPHPAEKYINSVKRGQMKPATALKKIDEVMYDIEKEGLPFRWKSVNRKKRIEALTKRVKAEDDFMRKVIDLIKSKSRFE